MAGDPLNGLWFAAALRGARTEDERVAWAASHGYVIEADGQVILTDAGLEYAERMLAEQGRVDAERPMPVPRGAVVAKLLALGGVGLGLVVALRRHR